MDNLKAGDSIKLRTLSKLSGSGKSVDEFGNVLFGIFSDFNSSMNRSASSRVSSLALCKKELIRIHLLE